MLELLKLAAVCGLIIMLLKKWDLGPALLLGALTLGVLFGLGPMDMLRAAAVGAMDIATLRLIVVILLIMTLAEMLTAVGSLERMVPALESLFVDNRLTLPLAPAFIGLLPMMGGAMFSAPMVNEIGSSLGLSNEHKTYINYWFRHVWEYVFPLYPALLLAASLLRVPVHDLMAHQYPLTLAALLGGIAFGLLAVRQSKGDTGDHPLRERADVQPWQNLRTLFGSMWPVAFVIVFAVVLKGDLIIGLVITLALMALVYRPSLATLRGVLRRGLSLQMALLIASVMVFSQVLRTSGAVDGVSQAFTQLGIPTMLVVFTLPLITGILTGMIYAAVGMSFPILIPLIANSEPNLTYAMLAFAGGMVGVMLTPLHLCLSLTRDYFHAEWGPLYRRIVPSALLIAATALLVAYLG